MGAADDAFLRFLASLSGHTVGFLPGDGGIDDALTSLAFLHLCRRHDVVCAPFAGIAGTADAPVVVGSLEVLRRERARLGDRRTAVLPGFASRFGDLDGVSGAAATVFWSDAASRRMAVLQGMPPERAVLCHHPAIHLDATALASVPDGAEGALTLDVGDRPIAAAGGDRILVRFDGGGGRWASRRRCLSAARGVAQLMAGAAEIRTDSPGLAILAAQLGKAVRLSPGRGRSNRAVFHDTIAPLYPTVTLSPGTPDEIGTDGDAATPAGGSETGGAAAGKPEAEVARLGRLLAAARREGEHLTQERDSLFVAVAGLRGRADADDVAVVRSHREARERAEAAERATAERLAAAEARAARESDVAAAAADRLASAEEAREAEAREATARQEAAERESALDRRLAASNAALDARTRQALALQFALDEHGARQLATGARIARMRAMIDGLTASCDEARRDAEAQRQRMQELASSTSWRLTQPVRALSRGIRRLAGTTAARAASGRDG